MDALCAVLTAGGLETALLGREVVRGPSFPGPTKEGFVDVVVGLETLEVTLVLLLGIGAGGLKENC